METDEQDVLHAFMRVSKLGSDLNVLETQDLLMHPPSRQPLAWAACAQRRRACGPRREQLTAGCEQRPAPNLREPESDPREAPGPGRRS